MTNEELLFGSLFEEETATGTETAQQQDTSPAPENTPEAPAKAVKSRRKNPAKKAETHEDKPAIKQVNVTDLINELNTKGEARLSDHATDPEPKPEPETEPDESPEDLPEELSRNDGQQEEQNPGPEQDTEDSDPDENDDEEEEENCDPAEEETSPAGPEAPNKPSRKKRSIIAGDALAAYIKEELDKAAALNPEFAKVYANPKKSLEECVLYVTGEVFKRAFKYAAKISNEEVLGMATHYYQEENCKPNVGDNIGVAIMHQFVPFSEADRAKITEMAKNEIRKEKVEEEKKRIKQDIASGKTTVTLTDDEQRMIDEAAREQMVEESKKRQRKNTTRISTAKPNQKTATEMTNSLF